MQETVNKRIAHYRKLRGLNQAELAKKIGMKPSTYSQMERCGNITTQRLLDIALVLKVDVNVLLYGEQDWEPVGLRESIEIYPPPPVYPIPPKPEPDKTGEVLILTQKEEMLVKLYRDFNKEEKEQIDKFMNDFYKKSKEKKRKKMGE